MRRSILISGTILAVFAGLAAPSPVVGQTDPADQVVEDALAQARAAREQVVDGVPDERRGLNYEGLLRRLGGPCGGAYEIIAEGLGVDGLVRCTHGPDPAPDGVDARVSRAPLPATAGSDPTPPAGTAAASPGIPCYGNGSDGYRVEVIYARPSGSADRYGQFASSFVTWAANADAVFNLSAAKTGGIRHIRYLTDASCNLLVSRTTWSGSQSFSTMISALKSQGFNRTDRKYLIFADSTVYCGIAEIYIDDKPNATPGTSSSNYSNGHPQVFGGFARVDSGCWGAANSVEAHEVVHELGGVQTSADNATSGYHCTDDRDRMCYADGSYPYYVSTVCTGANDENRLDCGDNDYFRAGTPPAGSYLANYWNVANSAFLAKTDPGGSPPPSTTTTVPPTTTTTLPPGTTTTTTLPPGTTTTTAPPTTTTTVPPAAGAPSAPRSLFATRPSSGGVRLYWTKPATGTVTGYNVYRRTASTSFAKIADLGVVTTYTDTNTVSGTTYYYVVTAENGALEGPASNQTQMTAR